ncbi:MAG TPA: hypothetical protein VIJ84_01570 [Gaiellaceae bacterium]
MRIGIAVALVTALLCGVLQLGSSTGQAAVSTGSISAKCFSYRATRSSNTFCEYRFEQPFLLTGYSKGGSSILSYTVQCGEDGSWPLKTAAIDRKVWFRRSFTVKGNFKLYGGDGAPSAARHCDPAQGKAPVLSVTLKMGRGVTKTNLIVRLDSSLPWGE